jgi:hypothetical protein
MLILNAVFGVLVAAGLSIPQVGAIWTFSLLRERSDVVVIANAVSMTDTGRDEPRSSTRALPRVEMETTFEILDVVKGGDGKAVATGGRITLFHYRHDMARWHAENPPEPGKPPPSILRTGSMITFSDGSGPYLLFLVRTARGLEPVSGHTWPTESVFDLRKHGRPPAVVRQPPAS